MCGRFALFATPELVAEYFDLAEPPSAATLTPRYNVTPGRAVAAIRAAADGTRRLDGLRWGLVPYWAKDASVGNRMINARVETLAAKPAFRDALQRRRCLIPASGFYEWRGQSGRRRQPFFVRPHADPLLAFAGLWERWRGAGDPPLESCVIVTTEANADLASIHERMPVMLARPDQQRWLQAPCTPEEIVALAARGPQLAAWPVAAAVNDPRNDDEGLIAPEPERELF